MSESTAPRQHRYALVGAGSRAQMYIDAVSRRAESRLIAIGDSNAGRAAHYRRRVEAITDGGPAPVGFDPSELERVIAGHDIDRVIVTSPDFTHAEYIVRALRAGADVVVEKPLTIDPAGARSIVAAIDDTGRNVVVTFNYRYSPRNSALKEVIASGRIGAVTSVDFHWMLDTVHGADYFRRWHRLKANSGGLLVHKASHHFDLVNWWIDDVPRRVFASGGLRFYGDQNARKRGIDHNDPRDRPQQTPFALDARCDDRLRELYVDNESYDGYRRDLDVFGTGITIEDNLSLVVDYAGGPSMSYSLNAHCPWEGYRVAVNGTKGRAELDVVERGAVIPDADGTVTLDPSATPAAETNSVRPTGERLVVQTHWDVARGVDEFAAAGAHGGGDDLLLRDVLDGPGDDPLGRPAGLDDGLRAIAVGIAGNASLATGEAVDIADLDLGRSL
ncbi:Gfo/Idh/MocA family protein [Spelaeicoccus albus]|uniref:Putative dehydrogenase n=1 Tax=Spelaeicoccus albus TaxID=1280376 RepID=A0A7Z0D1A9_9MICO|nr:Gfo/Idh/MocA family oxidoreductase [Spelaeicoccus albus]NYI66713.1 putative dehydrogenase [Spelaeicoccus albus]